jgi:hypothetical protein
MSRKAIYTMGFLLLLFIFFNCKEKKKVDYQENKTSEDVCFTDREKEGIIKTILETPDFQMFLHPDAKGRLPIQLVKNEFVTPNLEITANGLPVVFRDSLILPEGAIHRIRIIHQDCQKKEVAYSVFYPIEGAVLTGIISDSNSIWIASDTSWGIKD